MKKYFAAFIIMTAMVLAVGCKGKSKSDSADSSSGKDSNVSASAELDDIEIEDVLETNDLKTDEIPEINELIETYYQCMASGDVETIRSIVDDLSSDEESYINSLTSLIENYSNISCHTKKGPEDDSFIVFVRYDLKFVAADKEAPGVEAYYVRKNEAGEYYIVMSTPDTSLISYVNELITDDDVQALYAEVDEAFEQAKAEDAKLSEYSEKLGALNKEEPQEEEPEETAEEEQPQTNAVDENATATQSNRETRMGNFTGGMSVRSERSTESSKVTTIYKGTHVTVLEDYSDGWSKISFKDEGGAQQEGFVKTEYLE